MTIIKCLLEAQWFSSTVSGHLVLFLYLEISKNDSSFSWGLPIWVVLGSMWVLKLTEAVLLRL